MTNSFPRRRYSVLATEKGSIKPLPVVAELGGIEWPEAPSTPRFDGMALSAVRLLKADPFDPTCNLPQEMVHRLAVAADAVSDEQIQADLRGNDGGFQEIGRAHV